MHQARAGRARTSQRRNVTGVVVNSGQHAEVVERTFDEFGILCDVEVPPLPSAPNLSAASRTSRARLLGVILERQPSLVIVQGDTLTAYAGARVGARAGIPVVHVEAGLRTPFGARSVSRRMVPAPDRRVSPITISRRASRRRQPAPPKASMPASSTRSATPASTACAGCSSVLGQIPARWRRATNVLITLHRRENYDRNAEIVCDSLIELCAARPDLRLNSRSTRIPASPVRCAAA